MNRVILAGRETSEYATVEWSRGPPDGCAFPNSAAMRRRTVDYAHIFSPQGPHSYMPAPHRAVLLPKDSHAHTPYSFPSSLWPSFRLDIPKDGWSHCLAHLRVTPRRG